MPSTLLEYRLRIRNASTLVDPNGTADALVLTSQRGGTNPYIAEPPDGDGLELDPIKGATRTGSYNILVADPITSGTSRVVTSQLMDADNRQQLLSRRAYLEYRENSGAWTTMLAGYVLAIRLIDAITYQISIGDTRRIEKTKTLFQRDDPTYFPIRGVVVMGGPLVGGSFGPLVNRKGWQFRVSRIDGTSVGMSFVSGYKSNDGSLTSRWTDLVGAPSGQPSGASTIEAVGNKYYRYNIVNYGGWKASTFPGLLYRVYDTNGTLVGNFTPMETFVGSLLGGAGDTPHLRMYWTGSLPSVGAKYFVSLITENVTTDSSLYISGHPVDIAKAVYDSVNILVDSTSFTTLKALIGDDLRVTLKITEPKNMMTFLEDVLCGPFGIGLRVNSAGSIEAFSARIKTTTLPSATVNTSSLRSDSMIFDLDESTMVNTVVLECQEFSIYDESTIPVKNNQPVIQRPSDGILTSQKVVEITNGDVTTFGTREVKYAIPGMIHKSSSFASLAVDYTAALAREIFDRYGRGVQGADLPCLRGTGLDSVKVGDEIYVQPAHIPNLNKRYGDDNSVGARIMQVVRRTEQPEGPTFRVLDSGTAAQPVTAPVITVAARSADVSACAEFTITNAATLNAANLQVAVEWATGALAPTGNGADFVRFAGGSVPTAAYPLPPVDAGSTVWVRARTEFPGQRPSAWTAWVGVTLTAVSAPSGLSAVNIRKTAATLTWTNTSSLYDILVYVAPISASDPLADEWRVTRLMAASDRITVRNLEGPSIQYTASVRYLLPNGSMSAAAAVSITTNSTEDTIYRPAGIAIVQLSNFQDAALDQGVPIAIWPYDQILDVDIQRAPDSGGSPGTPIDLATVPGTTKVFVDSQLPSTNAVYWYRIRHSLGGAATTGWSCWVSSAPVGVPSLIERPSAVAPIVQVETTEDTSTATITLTITDPQCRVDVVRFRHRTNGGSWSAWTVDSTVPYSYSAAIPATGFVDINYEVIGFDQFGNYLTLAAGIESFDTNLSPDMVSCAGTFTNDGNFVLSWSADTDTASVKRAVSTSGFPSKATVQATTAVNSRNYQETYTTNSNVGTSVYVSMLGYTGANGTGTESEIFQYQFTREGLDIRVQEKPSESGATGTLDLIITDPTGRVSSVEYRTQVGRGAWSAFGAMTLMSPNNYRGTVTMVEKIPSKINYRLLGTSMTGQIGVGLVENVVTFAMGPTPMMPDVMITVREDGKVDVAAIGDSDTASLQVGFSTSSQSAANAALGSTVNARQTVFLNVGTLSLGQKGYVAVKAWDTAGGTGLGSVIAESQIVRFNVADTIKSWVAGSVGFSPSTELTGFGRGISDYAASPVSGGTTAYHYGVFLVPRGVTLRALRFQGYCSDANDQIVAKFYRVTAGAGSTQLGSTQYLTGGGTWTNVEVTSLSEDTTDRAYVVQVYVSWNSYPGPPSSILLGYLQAEYDKTAVNQNI